MIASDPLIPIYNLKANEEKRREVERNYICCACRGVLIDPIVCLECLSRFCKKCTYKNGCVNCTSEKISDCSKEIKDFLSSLFIKCTYCENGCMLEGKYHMILKHAQKCSFKSKQAQSKLNISSSLNVSNIAYQNSLQLKSQRINESMSKPGECYTNDKKIINFLESKNEILNEALQLMKQKLNDLPYIQLLAKLDEKLEVVSKRLSKIEAKLNIE